MWYFEYSALHPFLCHPCSVSAAAGTVGETLGKTHAVEDDVARQPRLVGERWREAGSEHLVGRGEQRALKHGSDCRRPADTALAAALAQADGARRVVDDGVGVGLYGVEELGAEARGCGLVRGAGYVVGAGACPWSVGVGGRGGPRSVRPVGQVVCTYGDDTRDGEWGSAIYGGSGMGKASS